MDRRFEIPVRVKDMARVDGTRACARPTSLRSYSADEALGRLSDEAGREAGCRTRHGARAAASRFVYPPKDAALFEELVATLRATEEWPYVEREVDIRPRRMSAPTAG